MKNLALKSFRLRNFKAVRDSGAVKFTPLTVLVGNNGSGKSSLVEGLETVRALALDGLSPALGRWHGIEHVRNKAARKQLKAGGGGLSRKAVEFALQGTAGGKAYSAATRINDLNADNEVCIEREELSLGRDWHVERDESGAHTTGHSTRRSRARRDVLATAIGDASAGYARLRPEESLLGRHLGDFLGRWQFLNLAAQQMGEPVPQTRTRGLVVLDKSGRNVAEYLLDIFKRDRAAFDGIVDTIRWVLPYAAGLQADIASELERAVYLQMTEEDFKVPGWLLSTGTLRILALLAVLRHPEPPPLLVVEEIENGLDPRSVHMLLDEVSSVVHAGRTQVIATTHSPYVLDLLPLRVLCLVERNASGEPVFRRPADDKEVRAWAKEFTPGKLYATGRFAGRAKS